MKFPFKTLMVQGTTSDAGKTTVVAALCRLLARQNVNVVPFKPQNMALNSAVTEDGGEIGRAQALQAQAAGVKPHSDMNPVLLKPSSDTNAQIIIHGKVKTEMNAQDFHHYKTLQCKPYWNRINDLVIALIASWWKAPEVLQKLICVTGISLIWALLKA